MAKSVIERDKTPKYSQETIQSARTVVDESFGNSSNRDTS